MSYSVMWWSVDFQTPEAGMLCRSAEFLLMVFKHQSFRSITKSLILAFVYLDVYVTHTLNS